MEIESVRFGTLSVREEDIIHMPFGMLGFPDMKRFVMIRYGEKSPFLWYQSLDEPALAFVMTNPFLFNPDYDVPLDEIPGEMEWGTAEKDDVVELYVVVNIPKGSPEKATANLIGPIVVNTRSRQAVQLAIADSPYSHRFPLIAPGREG